MTSITETDSEIQRTFWQLPDGRGIGGTGEKGEGIKKYKLAVMNGCGGVMCSTGNIVKGLLVAMCGVRGVRDLLACSPGVLCGIWSLGCIPETSTVLYVNCNWKFKKKL